MSQRTEFLTVEIAAEIEDLIPRFLQNRRREIGQAYSHHLQGLIFDGARLLASPIGETGLACLVTYDILNLRS